MACGSPFHFEPSRSFVHALPIALGTFRRGLRAPFKNIADMSPVVTALNKTLKSGGSLDGCTLHGPRILALAMDSRRLHVVPAPMSVQLGRMKFILRPWPKNHLAGCMAAFQQAVCFAGLRERQHGFRLQRHLARQD